MCYGYCLTWSFVLEFNSSLSPFSNRQSNFEALSQRQFSLLHDREHTAIQPNLENMPLVRWVCRSSFNLISVWPTMRLQTNLLNTKCWTRTSAQIFDLNVWGVHSWMHLWDTFVVVIRVMKENCWRFCCAISIFRSIMFYLPGVIAMSLCTRERCLWRSSALSNTVSRRLWAQSHVSTCKAPSCAAASKTEPAHNAPNRFSLRNLRNLHQVKMVNISLS